MRKEKHISYIFIYQTLGNLVQQIELKKLCENVFLESIHIHGKTKINAKNIEIKKYI